MHVYYAFLVTYLASFLFNIRLSGMIFLALAFLVFVVTA